MKRRLIALTLALALVLTGCASMLEREYVQIAPYQPVSAGDNSPSALRVESYQDLVNAILYLVTEGETHGVLGLYNYTADVESDLTRACLEVAQEDPLGAYAVDFIRYDYSLIVSYYEANIYITYRRTPEQVSSIVSVTGSTAIRRALRSALTDFSPEVVLRITYFFNNDEQYFLNLVRQAYYDAPASALGMPEVEISFYPHTGHQRIVEFTLTYPESQETLRRRSQLLERRLTSLAPLPTSWEELCALILDSTQMTGDGSCGTAYHALVENETNSEGAALALLLLCDRAGVECSIVQGELDGAPHFWNIVTDDGETYCHADLSAGLTGLSDEDLLQAGNYDWNRLEYPACAGSGPEEPPAEENQN